MPSNIPDQETLKAMFSGGDKAYSDDRLQLIGLIVTDWNIVEHCLELLIWRLAQLDADLGECFTTEMSIVSRITLAHNLLQRFHETESYTARISLFLELLDECRQARNAAIHCVVTPGEEDFVTIARAMKKRRGSLTVRVAPDDEELQILANAIFCLIEEAMRLFETLDGERPPSPDKDLLPVFAELLKRLRLERPAHDFRPQSSSE